MMHVILVAHTVNRAVTILMSTFYCKFLGHIVDKNHLLTDHQSELPFF